MSNEEFLAELREHMQTTKRMPNNSVIKCVQADKFSYAFLYVADLDKWYSTAATGYTAKVMTHDEFMTFLRRDDISNVSIASNWLALR